MLSFVGFSFGVATIKGGTVRTILRTLAVAATLLVMGCGPVYDTQYQMTPPPDPQGRMCAAQCLQTRDYCRENCRAGSHECEDRARRRARHDFDDYVRERRAKGLAIKRDLNSFVNTWECGSSSCEEGCGDSYRQCFSICGGTVNARKVCTAFCEPPPVPAAPPPASTKSGAAASGASRTACVRGARVQAYSEGEWYDAVVKSAPLADGRCPVHYDDYGADEDEAVAPSALRPRP